MQSRQEALDNLAETLESMKEDTDTSEPDDTNNISFDPALIEIGTVLELLSEPEFIFSGSEDGKLLGSKIVYVTEIIGDVEDLDLLIYRVDGMDEKDNLVGIDITDADIKKILAKVPYENLGKGFYKFKGKVYFNPNFDTSKVFSESDFTYGSELVKIIDDSTVEIKNKKFKKKLKKNW